MNELLKKDIIEFLIGGVPLLLIFAYFIYAKRY